MGYIKHARELILQHKLTTEDVKEMWIDALEAAGVDNWEGYDDAREIYFDLLKEALKEKQIVQNNV